MTAAKVGLISAGASGLATSGTLFGTTAVLSGPVANLGGYATAQILGSSVGLAGPGLSVGIAAVGGPLVAGALATGGVALVFGAAGYGLYGLCRLFLGR